MAHAVMVALRGVAVSLAAGDGKPVQAVGTLDWLGTGSRPNKVLLGALIAGWIVSLAVLCWGWVQVRPRDRQRAAPVLRDGAARGRGSTDDLEVGASHRIG